MRKQINGLGCGARVRAAGGAVAERHDAVADALIAVFSALASYDQRRPFSPWAYRIAANRFSGLPEMDRRIAMLKFYEQMSAAGIGRVLGMPAGTVRLMACRPLASELVVSIPEGAGSRFLDFMLEAGKSYRSMDQHTSGGFYGSKSTVSGVFSGDCVLCYSFFLWGEYRYVFRSAFPDPRANRSLPLHGPFQRLEGHGCRVQGSFPARRDKEGSVGISFLF
jgi:hypothetical protein